MAAGLASKSLVAYSNRDLTDAAGELMKVQEARRQYESNSSQRILKPDFRQYLPNAAARDEVVRVASRDAQSQGLQISNLSVERRPASQGELGQSRLSLTMVSSYPAFKSWLADMQGRFPALAVESLQLRRVSDGQQEVQLVLTLFTQD
jgi:hypothetical protein